MIQNHREVRLVRVESGNAMGDRMRKPSRTCGGHISIPLALPQEDQCLELMDIETPGLREKVLLPHGTPRAIAARLLEAGDEAVPDVPPLEQRSVGFRKCCGHLLPYSFPAQRA